MSLNLSNNLGFVFGRVWHARYRPVLNSFRYPVTYFLLPLSKVEQFNKGLLFGLNRPALLSVYFKDYGPRGSQSCKDWVTKQLSRAGLDFSLGEVQLLAMPRFLGYVFNPVCFWFCYDLENELKAVVTEVNNTFGQTHIYLCHNDDGSSITEGAEIWAHKEFHVSPFFRREGMYKFNFNINDSRVNIAIDYLSKEGDKLLSTQLSGPVYADSWRVRAKSLVYAPTVSLFSSMQIGWQALKLKAKKLPWIDKPLAIEPSFTPSSSDKPNT